MTATVAAPHIFLSYHAPDREAVRRVRQHLTARGIRTFLDKDGLARGLPWPQALEQALGAASGVLVFLGRELGGWQRREMWFALDRQVAEERSGHAFPVIPVLLPGADPASGFLSLNTWVDLSADAENPHEIDALLHAIAGDQRLERAAPAPTLCPYVSLRAFREEQAAFFVGREVFTRRLLDTLESATLVGVVGASGSGKSSVVHAGLVPALRMRRPPAASWDVATFTPGEEPFRAMSKALLPLLEPEMSEIDRLVEARKLAGHLAAKEIELIEVVDRALDKSSGTDRLLLVVDQFEELFTSATAAERTAFIDSFLTSLAADARAGRSRFAVVLTLRADFYARALEIDRRLSDRLEKGQINLGPMSRDELLRAIVEPAGRIGVTFETGLSQRIADDVVAEPGRLPLLQYALTQVWPAAGRVITHAAYQSVGGVAGSIAERAEAEFGRLEAGEQEAARRVMTALVQLAAGGAPADTRRRVPLATFAAKERTVIDRFAADRTRLVVTGRDEADGGIEIVEVAHEALIEHWKRLRDWLDVDREFLLWQQRAIGAFDAWQAANGDDGALLRGTLLEEARRWHLERFADLGPGVRQLIERSLEVQAQEKREAEEMQRRLLAQLARFLMAVALKDRLEYPRRSLLLAIEACNRSETQETEDALREILSDLGGMPLVGHLGPVKAVAFSPDGRLLASASDDGTVRIWFADEWTREPIVLRGGHAGTVACVAFSPDSQWLASGGVGGKVQLWRVRRPGEIPREIAAHEGDVKHLAFSIDGRLLASIGPSTLKLWSIERPAEAPRTYEPERPDATRSHRFLDLAFTPDGKALVATASDATLWVWVGNGLTSGPEIRRDLPRASRVSFTADGRTLALAAYPHLLLYSLQHGSYEPRQIDLGPGVRDVAFSPRDDTFAFVNEDSTIHVRDAEQERALFRGHEGTVESLAYSPDGEWLASGGRDATVRVWTLDPLEREPVVFHGDDDPAAIAFTPDGRHLAILGADSMRLYAVARAETRLRVLREFDHVEGGSGLAVSQDCRWLACSDAGGIRLWRLDQLDTAPAFLPSEGGIVSCLAFSGDGKWLASGSEDGNIRLWTVNRIDDAPVILPGNDSSPIQVAFHPDSHVIASGNGNGTLRYWSLSALAEPLTTIDARMDSVTSLAFSPDCAWLACGDHWGQVLLWSCEDVSRVVYRIPHRQIGDTSVAFSSDSRWFARGAADGVRIWSVTALEASGRRFVHPSGLLRFEADRNSIVAFSPDGRRLAGASRNAGAICLWTIDIDEVKRKAAAVAGRKLLPEELDVYFHDGVQPVSQ